MQMIVAPKVVARVRRPPVSSRRGRKLDPDTPARIARRGAALEPLFAYMKAHHMTVLGVVREACALAGEPPMQAGRVYAIRLGTCFTPDWFVECCCRAMGRTVAEVMGSDYCGQAAYCGRSAGRVEGRAGSRLLSGLRCRVVDGARASAASGVALHG